MVLGAEGKDSTMTVPQEIIELSPCAIVQATLEGTILGWNPAASELYGWLNSETIGQNLFDILGQDLWTWRVIRTALSEKSVYEMDERHRTKAGETLLVHSRYITSTLDGQRSITAFLLDITERKRLQRQLTRSNRLESIGIISAGLATEIHQMLGSAVSSMRALRQKVRDKQDENVLNQLEGMFSRGTALLEKVLTFSHGQEIERGSIHLQGIIHDVEKVLRETFPRSVRLQFCLSDHLWPVLADPLQVHQILANLCVNAWEAMPGGGELVVDAENVVVDPEAARKRGVAGGPYVALIVRDSGTGLAPEHMEKMFDLFFTTKSPSEGKGLGLSTVQALVKAHKGFLRCVSKPGLGTAVIVFLPASEALFPSVRVQLELTAGQGELVLAVNDEQNGDGSIRKQLESKGYSVLVADDASSAIAGFRGHADTIRAVIVDLEMPGLDGRSLICELRKIRPAIDIIALSDLLKEQDSIPKLCLEATLYLNKPFSPETLVRSLHGLIGAAKPSPKTPGRKTDLART